MYLSPIGRALLIRYNGYMKTTRFPIGHLFNPTILRAYDIRGIVGKTLYVQDAYYIGKAFATIVKQRTQQNKICVGYDGRLSSPVFEQSLVSGMVAAGADVLRVGLCPTPMLYYASHFLDAAAGVMVTGSHNPPDYNGFKFILDQKPFYGDDILEIAELVRMHACDETSDPKEVKNNHQLVRGAYIDRILQAYPHNTPLKVAWDTGNGATGEVVRKLCAFLPGMHILINANIDGLFPAHHPDPTIPKNLRQLIGTVKEHGCDFGVAFDGDGDRIGVVDNEGTILWGDQMLALFAQDILLNKPGLSIIADVKASQLFFDHVRQAGGHGVMWKTGHSHIKAKMQEIGSPLAGEMSGHIFFADKYYGYDDAIYAALRLMDMVARKKESLSRLAKTLPHYINTPEFRIDCDEARKFDIVDEVAKRLKERSQSFIDVDGVRVQLPHGWWLLRASNTQSALIIRCEASTLEDLEKLKMDVIEQLEHSGLACHI